MLNRSILLLFILVLSGCGTMPGKTYERIKSSNLVHSSALELVKTNPPKVELMTEAIDFSIDEKSPVVSVDRKLTVGNSFRIKTKGVETPFLVLNSWYHKVSMTGVGLVFPKVFFFDQNHKPVKPMVAQVGVDPHCGLRQCLKTTFRIADLPAGTYNVVVTSQVDEVDRPLKENRADQMVYAAGVGLIPISTTYTIYADFFGSFTARFAKELPMDRNRKDIKTFIE